MLLVILISTDSIIAPPKYYNPTGWENTYGNLFLLLLSSGMYTTTTMYFILWHGIKLSANIAERKFLMITFSQ